MSRKALVSLSGGMDSATMLAVAVSEYDEVKAIGFTYGSKHNPYENEAALNVAAHYGVEFELLDLSSVFSFMESNLLKKGEAIPEGHYQQSNMSLTVVPGRNMIFCSILAGIAWSQGARAVFLGAHSGDHVIYPDCRPEFVLNMAKAVRTGTDYAVDLKAPFLHGSKETILEWGIPNGVPYHLTRTCYKDQKVACGKCGACQERLIAFAHHGVEDPIEYESREILPKE